MDETTPVLIVGGSMVGLAQALFLAQQGIRPILVEQHAEISAHPRAQAASPRTMELMRALGLEKAVRAQENPYARYGNILQAESLVGAELGWFDGPFRHTANEFSATGWTLIGQDRFEPVLRDRAEELGADVRFATELVRHEQDADGVSAVLRDLRTGEEHTVRAQYLIAADGHRSSVRQGLGIATHGQGVFGRQLNVIFHADLDGYVGDREFFLCFINNAEVKGVLGKLDDVDRWVLAPSLAPEESHNDYPAERCAELVRAAVGVADLPVAVETVTSWEISARIADRFRAGRVLLVGDAAHVMPPTGGFGGNMGIQDAHNLAWKLALVLSGRATPDLLDTYEEERLPVAEFTVEQGVIRYLQRSGLDEDFAARHRPEPTVLFGHVYRSRAVLAEDTAAEPDGGAAAVDPLSTGGRPGTRAPHLTFRHNNLEIAPHDLLSGGFLLIAGPEGGAWEDACHAARTRTGLRLDVCRPDDDGPLGAAYGIGRSGAALIRPDGFIAWRSRDLPAAPAEKLATALDRLLHSGAVR
ncbi:FAD-dependent monooxygenase [Streptomyces kronopolitis]|uniref:FAD-dependent monooxygenase n=1 Tax=Streptomyces kronopolitis TaxID=1612435 RepID=UPI0034381E26